MVSFDMNKKYSHELATFVSSYAVLQLQVLPAYLDPAGPLFIHVHSVQLVHKSYEFLSSLNN